MGTLLEEMTRAETTKVPAAPTTGNTSVMGHISPHDETGSESPPSYNQLNYNDNLTRFFNSQPKTLTEKEASAIESSSVLYADKFKFQSNSGDSGSGSGSRNLHSASPPLLYNNTVSENISNNLKHKSAYAPHAADQGSGGGDSGENGGTGSGHGTSGGVSAAGANTHHKRIHAHTYGRNSATGSGNNSGVSDAVSNSGNTNGADHYKPPLLTEQLLSAHNRGMEKKMIDR